MFVTWFSMLGFALLPGLSGVQASGCTLAVETTVLELRESITARVICENTPLPAPPEFPATSGLEVQLLGETPGQSSMVSIVGGQRTSRVTYTYALRVTALKPGTWTLGPATVNCEGTILKTDAVPVTVQQAVADARVRGDRSVFVEIDVFPREVYVTQTVKATLTIGIRKVVQGGREIDLDLFRSVLDQGASEFSVFPGGRQSTRETVLTDSGGVRYRYQLLTVEREIRAEQPGTLAIGPVFIKANYPIELRRGFSFFDSYQITRARRETDRAEAVEVRVKAPPDTGRPPTFTGAIGHFNMQVSATPKHVKVGEPITLTIAIRGTPLEGVAPPRLADHAELVSRFDFTRDEPAGDIEGNAKVFRRALFPRQEGEQTIPSIQWSFFDVQRETYVTVAGAPITVQVDPADPRTGVADLPGVNGRERASGLTVVRGGLSPNYVEPAAALAAHEVLTGAPVVTGLVLPPVAWACVALVVRHKRRLEHDEAFARRRGAARRAKRLLAAAAALTDRQQQLAQLNDAFVGYLTDRFDLPPGNRTPQELRQALAARGVADELAERIGVFLEQGQAARFASDSQSEVLTGEAFVQIASWIRELERLQR